ncbi:MAG: STAS domain-containing protein [Candidatus Eremiobacteraeota bacterium]|nr:STAS domain-containing protein [Candidatus Eremiobacteraeota bacterium]
MTTDTVLVLSKNEYDLYTMEGLWQELQGAPAGSDVTLDFCNVRYMDGASLGVLVRYAKALKRKHDSRLHIVHANALIERVLHITCLDRLFDVVRSAPC